MKEQDGSCVVRSRAAAYRAAVEPSPVVVSSNDELKPSERLGTRTCDQRRRRLDGLARPDIPEFPTLNRRTRKPATAHMEHHAVAYGPTSPDTLRHVVVSDDGRVLRDLAIPVEDGQMAHDCACTNRVFVVLDLSMGSLLSGHEIPYRCNPKHPARVGLPPRDGGADGRAILDARAIAGEPVATIHLPHRIPPGFHGNWVPA